MHYQLWHLFASPEKVKTSKRLLTLTSNKRSCNSGNNLQNDSTGSVDQASILWRENLLHRTNFPGGATTCQDKSMSLCGVLT